MTQEISFDFIVSNFIGTGNASFNNNLSKLKYPNFTYMTKYTYILKTTTGLSFSLQFENGNKYYFIDNQNRKYPIVRLDYLVNQMITQYFKYNNSSMFIIIISRQGNGIKCTLMASVNDQTIMNYVGKNYSFETKGTIGFSKYCLEELGSSYNNTYISSLSETFYYLECNNMEGMIDLQKRVQVLSPHLTDDNQQQYYDLINEEGRKTLMAINSSYVNGNSINFNCPVIFIDITTVENVCVINNIYINDGNAKFFYPNSNGSIQLIGDNHSILKINQKENCLFNCIMINDINDLTISGNYKNFNLYYIGIREPKPQDIPITSNYIQPTYCDLGVYLNSLSITFHYELDNLFENVCGFGYGISYGLIKLNINSSSNKCSILVQTKKNDIISTVYSISNLQYRINQNYVFIGNDDDILIEKIGSNWQSCYMYTSYNNGIVKKIFPPGYFFNALFQQSNNTDFPYSTNDYFKIINNKKYSSCNFLTIYGI